MKIIERQKHSLMFVSNPGNRFKEEYHGVLDDDGYITLVSDGFTDTQKMIESDAVGSDVKSLIAKALAGDVSVFRADAPFYADVANMPKTYAQILNIVRDAHAEFNRLPLNIRQNFNNDFEAWFATLGTEDWFKRSGVELTKNETAAQPVEEVKE